MEIRCPHCDFTKEIDENKIASDITVATCPKCNTRFAFREKENFLFEQAPIPQEESPFHPANHEENDQPLQDDQEYTDIFDENIPDIDLPDIPWARSHEMGFFPAIIETVKGVMFSPGHLFYGMRRRAPFSQAFGFYMLMSVAGLLIGLMWDVSIGNPFLPSTPAPSVNELLANIVVSPILFTFALYLLSGITHGILMLSGGNRAGFGTTIRVVAYTSALNALYILPFIGPIVASIWSLYAIALGLRAAHRISFGKVLPAIFVLGTIQAVVAITMLKILLASNAVG